jgi:hypothetical protein
MIADVLTATVKNNIIQGFAKGIKVDTGVALTEDYNIFYNTNDDI